MKIKQRFCMTLFAWQIAEARVMALSSLAFVTKQWKSCIHEWKQSYVDPMILDGTQWGLELTLTKGRHYNISGSNAFPALYKDLVRVFKPYMKKAKEG